MRSETRYLLDRLDKVLDDARAVGRLGISLAVTFALALLAAHSKGEDFVCGFVTPEGAFFTISLVLLFLAFYKNLAYSESEINRIITALQVGVAQPQSSTETEEEISPADLSRLLDTKPLLAPSTGKAIAWWRLGSVGGLLLLCWVNVVDIVPDFDIRGKKCEAKRAEKSVPAPVPR